VTRYLRDVRDEGEDIRNRGGESDESIHVDVVLHDKSVERRRIQGCGNVNLDTRREKEGDRAVYDRMRFQWRPGKDNDGDTENGRNNGSAKE
jgi:hypothetical protein